MIFLLAFTFLLRVRKMQKYQSFDYNYDGTPNFAVGCILFTIFGFTWGFWFQIWTLFLMPTVDPANVLDAATQQVRALGETSNHNSGLIVCLSFCIVHCVPFFCVCETVSPKCDFRIWGQCIIAKGYLDVSLCMNREIWKNENFWEEGNCCQMLYGFCLIHIELSDCNCVEG